MAPTTQFDVAIAQLQPQQNAELHTNRKEGLKEVPSPPVFDVFIKPDIISFSNDVLPQLIKPIYGLTESGEYWHETLRVHQRQDLSMKATTTGDYSLLFRRVSNLLIDLSGTYIDDFLRAGTDAFRSSSLSSTRNLFNTKEPTTVPFEFTGLLVSGENTYATHLTNNILNASSHSSHHQRTTKIDQQERSLLGSVIPVRTYVQPFFLI